MATVVKVANTEIKNHPEFKDYGNLLWKTVVLELYGKTLESLETQANKFFQDAKFLLTSAEDVMHYEYNLSDFVVIKETNPPKKYDFSRLQGMLDGWHIQVPRDLGEQLFSLLRKAKTDWLFCKKDNKIYTVSGYGNNQIGIRKMAAEHYKNFDLTSYSDNSDFSVSDFTPVMKRFSSKNSKGDDFTDLCKMTEGQARIEIPAELWKQLSKILGGAKTDWLLCKENKDFYTITRGDDKCWLVKVKPEFYRDFTN